MSKISELSDGGSLLPTDFLIAVRSGGNVKVQADQTEFDRIRLGDNEKIELGNSQDMELYFSGAGGFINNTTGDLTLDVAGRIILDADTDGDIRLQDGGSFYGQFFSSGDNLYIRSRISDKDIIFNGNDDGTFFDALTLDMSLGGAATFNAGVTSGAHLINASSSAFGGSSVQGFNTDFLVDTGQGYARHNSYHTGGSNHQFLVNEAGSTTNAVAFSIAKDKSATFNSDVSLGGSSLNFTKADGVRINAKESLIVVIDSDNNDAGRVFQVQNGAGTNLMHNSESGGTVFNEGGDAALDFRVESDSNDHMLFVDGGNDKVVMGSSSIPVLNGSSTRTYDLVLDKGVAIGNSPYTHGYIGTDGTDGNVVITANSYSANLGGTRYVKITGGTAGGGGPNSLAEFNGDTGAVFNAGSQDLDFRVESDAITHALFVEGSTGQLRVNTANWPTNSFGDSAGRHIVGGPNEPLFVLWNEADSAANNLSTLAIGAKSATATTDFGGGWIRGGLENNSDSDGFLGFYTTKDAGTNAEQLRISSSGAATFNAGATFGGNITATAATINGQLNVTGTTNSNNIYAQQVSTQFDTSSFLRFHPTSVVDSGGFTNIFFGTSTTNNYGVAVGGKREGTSGEPSFEIRMLNDSTVGTEVLNITNAGEVTMPSQPAFQVSPASIQSNIAVGSDVTVVLGTEVFDVGANFASNTFTAPVTGKYQLNVSWYFNHVDTASDYYVMALKTSNRTYNFVIDPGAFSSDPIYWNTHGVVLADMDAGDTAYIIVNQASGTAQTDIALGTIFSGYLVA
jgi:hypothetical protein